MAVDQDSDTEKISLCLFGEKIVNPYAYHYVKTTHDLIAYSKQTRDGVGGEGGGEGK